MKLPLGTRFDYTLGQLGLLSQIRLDMGQVISAQPRLLYPDHEWSNTYNNKLPEVSKDQVVVEYTAHPDARFHLTGGNVIPVSEVVAGQGAATLVSIAPRCEESDDPSRGEGQQQAGGGQASRPRGE